MAGTFPSNMELSYMEKHWKIILEVFIGFALWQWRILPWKMAMDHVLPLRQVSTGL